jgi:hypothetical protein
MSSNTPKNKTRKVGFSNKARVRNQYMNGVSVNMNEYNVNEDPVNSPGYPLTSSKYVPHSKSSLVRAMRKMGPNVGWGPAVSSVGNSNWNASKLPEYMAIRNNMKAQYGNKWIEAEVVKNNSERALQAEIKRVNKSYKDDMAALEKDFVTTTGIISPSELDKTVKKEVNNIEADYDSRLISERDARRMIKEIYDNEEQLTNSMPPEKRTAYMEAWLNLEEKLKEELKEAKALLEPYTSFAMGTPYPRANTNFTKKLRNARKRAQNFINGK